MEMHFGFIKFDGDFGLLLLLLMMSYLLSFFIPPWLFLHKESRYLRVLCEKKRILTMKNWHSLRLSAPQTFQLWKFLNINFPILNFAISKLMIYRNSSCLAISEKYFTFLYLLANNVETILWNFKIILNMLGKL
mgnify:CR=1 FL=1